VPVRSALGREALDHVLFADEHHAAARALQAEAFERIAFGTGRVDFAAALADGTIGSTGIPRLSARSCR
jgi:alkyl sulfatase BDS1-like metallo-beta-lactamase superfamily hydrolase